MRAAALILLLAAARLPGAETRPHPLDALTAPEYWAVYEALKSSGRVDAATRYAGITLHEPPKAEVLQWKPGQPFRREATVVVKQGARTFEALIDVKGRRVLSWTELPGVQPNLIPEEFEGIEEAVKHNEQWRAAMRNRGITDLDTISCDGNSPGYFATPGEQGRRLLRVTCTDFRGTQNSSGRSIEGLIVEWDCNERKVLRVIDTGPVPVPRGAWDYDVDSIGKLREIPGPISVEQPQGPGYRLTGRQVEWQNWRFHFRTDSRVGLVITNVEYRDGDRYRSMMYEGSLSEIFVPYMDPNEGWYYISFIDAGEGFNFRGGVATPLEPGTDCPQHAAYFDSVFGNQKGIPVRRYRTACLFERETGDIAWRHQYGADQIESRKRRDLVLRMMATIGNYDYVFDWVFRQDGSIRVGVGATGILAVKSVRSRTAQDAGASQDLAYGHLVAENVVGPNHDHFFSFRLDLDVDGAANSLLIERLKAKRLGPETPRRSIWVIEPQIAKVERDAELHMMMDKPALWRVINPSVKGPLGNPVSLQIAPGHNAMTLLSADDWPRRRASFIDYNLWVTPYRAEERYAAGEYPTQSKGEDGLGVWTRANRVIENTDIVAWYTMGFHHTPRQEDWPVMPTVWHEFELRPFDFFAQNPAMDLPK